MQRQEVNLTQEFHDRISKLEKRSVRMQELEVKVEQLEDIEERVEKLEELTKVSTLRSCSEYVEFGLSITGFYLIDPDGPLVGQSPIQVLCNFTSGSTEILHDSAKLTQVEHCHDAGCYEKEVTYINGATNEPIPFSQIDSLIQISDYCVQEFYYECTLAPLRAEELDYAFWTDRHGGKNVYFTGSNKGFHSCDCYFSEEGCFEHEQRSNTCNCDANLPAPLVDTGTITNTTALPVTKLAFGGLTYEIQTGSFQLGNLQCFGKKKIEASTSCSSLKLTGITLSGYYNIKRPGDDYTTLVFCNMSENGYIDVPETDQTDQSPLGTIAAWVAKPSLDSEQEREVPDGWVLCDGSTIEKGPWKGGSTPNLNSGHFLRGGELNQQLETEEDQVQDHEHADPGHTHSASSSSSEHDHIFEEFYMYGNGDTSYTGHCYQDVSCSQYDHISHRTPSTEPASVDVSTTVSSHTTGISGMTSSARYGEETRPRNMKISWIIKCW